MAQNKGEIFLNTFLWGFLLWFFGYILGIIFFAFVPKDSIGWFVSPLGVIATLWVLFKKIQRDSLAGYIVVGIIWLLITVVFDYLFLVRLFNSADYYKLDVYIYYFLTLALPVAVGWFKLKNR